MKDWTTPGAQDHYNFKGKSLNPLGLTLDCIGRFSGVLPLALPIGEGHEKRPDARPGLESGDGCEGQAVIVLTVSAL